MLRRRGLHLAGVLVTGAILVGLAVTGHKMLLAPLVLSVAACGLAFGEMRRSEEVRGVLVHNASAMPRRGSVLMPDAAVAEAIRSVTLARPRVFAEAASVVASWPGSEREQALRRLGTAQRSRGPQLSPVDREVLLWAAAAGVFTIMSEVL
jgi:hypothetical protein